MKEEIPNIKTNTNDPDKKSSKSWLQRLKDESWEAELLVSAIAIFGTFQLFGFIGWGTNKFIDLLDPSQYLIGYTIIFLGLFAISILASMFLIHFFLRAYWIGLVGLNSVFPDYSIEDSAYSKIYTEKILSILPKLEDSIKKVDEICSVIFSAAFTFLFIYTYMAIIASVYLLIYNLLSSYVSIYILLIPLVFIICLLLMQSILTIIANLKGNKDNEKLQIWNFKIVKTTSKVLYGPLYKSILQVSMIFGSNFKKNKSLSYLMFLFLFSGVLLAFYQIKETNIFYLIVQDKFSDVNRVSPNYYESENVNNDFLLTPEIKSDIIKSNVIKVFIPIFSNEENRSKEVCGNFIKDESKSRTENRDERRLHHLSCYNKYNVIYINGGKVEVNYLKYTHSRTKQFGILGYIKLSKPKMGMNKIKIKKEFDKDNIKEWTIPFYFAPDNYKE